ncbi:YegP family protein [Pseudomonas rossensis]|uniref:YegP family protein n=1 Tax=Pseudomonas rossensis TaxID=2305471 RepID=UPI003260686E
MAGWYELSKSTDGQFRFVLKAGNAEIILTSERYTTRSAAENGIASVQVNSPVDARYAKEVAKDGKPYFNLKAANHQVIGNSQRYSSEAARAAGIESVKTNGPSTTIKDQTV